MIDNYEIIPGKGFDKVELGANRDDIKKILGEPDEIDNYSLDGDASSDTFYYDSMEMSLSFDSDVEFSLTEISIEGEKFHIKDLIKIGITKNQLIEYSEKLEYSAAIIEKIEEDEFPGDEIISFEEEGLNFWIEDNKVINIQLERI